MRMGGVPRSVGDGDAVGSRRQRRDVVRRVDGGGEVELCSCAGQSQRGAVVFVGAETKVMESVVKRKSSQAWVEVERQGRLGVSLDGKSRQPSGPIQASGAAVMMTPLCCWEPRPTFTPARTINKASDCQYSELMNIDGGGDDVGVKKPSPLRRCRRAGEIRSSCRPFLTQHCHSRTRGRES